MDVGGNERRRCGLLSVISQSGGHHLEKIAKRAHDNELIISFGNNR